MAMYTPLAPGRIRVLDLKQDLTGSLRSIPIEAEGYTAVSYVWGVDFDCSITIYGHPFQVTRNLYHALREIAPGTFWIDQICINQQDDEEKAEQIQLMRRIFQKKVIGWLGNEASYSGLVIQFLRELAGSDLGKTVDGWVWPGWVRQQAIVPCARLLYFCELLLQRPWFKRRWIVQEAAAMELTLLCGGEAIPGEIFFRGIERLSTSTVHQEALSLVRRPRDILLLLDGFSKWDCKLQADRIIALVGVSNTRWVPTYVDTYLNFAMWHLKETHTLELLHYAGHRRTDLPSWVPDWTVKERPAPMRGAEIGQAQFEFRGTTLAVRGYCLGFVHSVSAILRGHMDLDSVLESLVMHAPITNPDVVHLSRKRLISWIDLVAQRRLLYIEGFNHIGIGPAAAKRGHQVWHVSGLSALLVADGNRLVGHYFAPVQSLNDRREDSAPLQWLTLE